MNNDRASRYESSITGGDDFGTVPRENLGDFPTPLKRAPCLTEELGGPEIYIKRDDRTGFAGGGNKIRTVEYLLGEASASGADVIICQGGPQSNCIRSIVVSAKKLGFEVVPIIYGNPPEEIRGNYIPIKALSDRIVFTHDPSRDTVEVRAQELKESLQASGKSPYVVPRGGAKPAGALGYMRCAKELKTQASHRGLKIDEVIMPSGSCTSQTGMILGKCFFHAGFSVEGILVSRREAESRHQIRRLINAVSEKYSWFRSEAPDEAISVTDEYLGGGFSVTTVESGRAFRTALRTEGLIVDPVYTAKGMAGLIDRVRSGYYSSDETIVFIHTGGESLLYSFEHGFEAEKIEPQKVY